MTQGAPLTKCQHDGCQESECTFRFQFPDGADAGWLCYEHAAEHGFCPRCGNFIAGSGEETASGMCRGCAEEFEAECGEADEEDELELELDVDLDEEGDQTEGAL